MSHSENFVSNYNIPDFIKQDHDLFEAFIKAYYEWLEIQKDSENNNYSDVYKAVGNPGYIINNQKIVVDIDDTIDRFIDYFAEEVVPISLEGVQTNPRFFLKKVRELYLAKGTTQSFILFFKLYYNDNINVFETRDTVLRASDGKYFAFPTAHFYVTEYQDQISEMDFTLSELLDSEENYVVGVLDAYSTDITNEGQIILKTQLTADVELNPNSVYYIKSADGKYRIKLNSMVSLTSFGLKETAPLYEVKDTVYVKSANLGKTFYGSVNSTSSGTVSGIKTRNTGISYTVGDYFDFKDDTTISGRVSITSVDELGGVTSIDNINLRTGTYNNGYLSNTLEDVFVGIKDGGFGWKTLPRLEYKSLYDFNSDYGQPYINFNKSGSGLQIVPLTNTIGSVRNIGMNQNTYFLNDSDIRIQIPANIIVENNTLVKGDIVSFQTFGNKANFGPLLSDSDSIKFTIKQFRNFDSHIETGYIYRESEIRTQYDIAIPYGFDSDTFDWKWKNVRVDSNYSNFWQELENLLQNESNLSYKITKRTYNTEIVDGSIYPNPVVYNFVHEFETTDSGLKDNEPVYYFYHTYDTTGTEISSTQNETIYFSSTGSIRDFQTSNIAVTTTGNANIFDPIKNFVTANHGGTSSFVENLYVDTTIDGGVAFIAAAIGDSDYDGGAYDADADGVLDGFDAFNISRSEISALKITYNVDFFGSFDSEVPRASNNTVYFSSTGSIDDLRSDSVRIDSAYDSELFKNVKSKISTLHNGAYSLVETLYVPMGVDAGNTYSGGPYDSEYDGGRYDSEADGILDSFDNFITSKSEVSTLVLSYDSWMSDSEYASYQSFTEDSDDITKIVDGGRFFGFAGSTVEEIEVEYEGAFVSTLDRYHFEQIEKNSKQLDSEYLSFEYEITKGDTRLLETFVDSDMGNWSNEGYFGEVVDVSQDNRVVKIIEWNDNILPTQNEIDDWSSDFRQVVRLSKVVNGSALKGSSLPLTNVVHQISRAEISYTTGVVSNLIKKFYNDDGFISSDYGGTLQDNYFYSDWSYRIKSKLPFADWKDKFKKMLHPAGMVLTADYVNSSGSNGLLPDLKTDFKNTVSNALTFDMQNEYISYGTESPFVSADNINYKSNAFENYNKNLGYWKQLESSTSSSIINFNKKTQYGNSWWDYEPIGWIRETSYDVIGSNDYLNFDSETHWRNKWSTQDSDGSGHVASTYTYYQTFNGSKQDLFKNRSRIDNNYNRIVVSKVQFEQAGFEQYSVYDSDLPQDFFVNFNDSDNAFKGIDYDRLKSDSDNRSFFYAIVQRGVEIKRLKNKDLELAMREDGSLAWNDSDKTYYDYEAYERKWNQINNRRTINNEGYLNVGKEARDSFHKGSRQNKYRGGAYDDLVSVYSNTNKPYNSMVWSYPSIRWVSTYYEGINTIVNVPEVAESTYRDPQKSMRGRRGGR